MIALEQVVLRNFCHNVFKKGLLLDKEGRLLGITNVLTQAKMVTISKKARCIVVHNNSLPSLKILDWSKLKSVTHKK